MKFEPIDKLINKEQSFKQNLFNKEWNIKKYK
jgi:hypothetical protein